MNIKWVNLDNNRVRTVENDKFTSFLIIFIGAIRFLLFTECYNMIIVHNKYRSDKVNEIIMQLQIRLNV